MDKIKVGDKVRYSGKHPITITGVVNSLDTDMYSSASHYLIKWDNEDSGWIPNSNLSLVTSIGVEPVIQTDETENKLKDLIVHLIQSDLTEIAQCVMEVLKKYKLGLK